jgi:hypothetical protein|tara:strand:+ start:152 stop:334 length:183 start_codon:yes stop_codon:yes gene_type:complete
MGSAFGSSDVWFMLGTPDPLQMDVTSARKPKFHSQYVSPPFDLRLTIGESVFDLRLILKQ